LINGGVFNALPLVTVYECYIFGLTTQYNKNEKETVEICEVVGNHDWNVGCRGSREIAKSSASVSTRISALTSYGLRTNSAHYFAAYAF
jgi:hypothetical protein